MNRPQQYRLPPLRIEATCLTLAETIDWGLAAYGVPEQWKQSRGGGIKVAVLDTGLDAAHADLADGIDEARDFTASRQGPHDAHGHGTHVAGIVAARQNGGGVVGVAPQCRLLVAKVLDDSGSGAIDAIVAGIDWACRQGADVLSLSFGSPQASPELEAALTAAVEQGKFVVCAAGNDGRADTVNYPARWPFTVAVGAVDREGRIARFSSRGEAVDICAPGEGVLSTWTGGGYARLSGTSMAAPFVTGIVALMLAKHRQRGSRTPVRTQGELLEHLRRTAVDAGPTGHDPSYGYGLIDPGRLLAEADDAVLPNKIEIGPLQINGVEGVLVFVPK